MIAWMLGELGTVLRQQRHHRAESLATVAGPANISATYLQKLERGEVGSPSPRVLRRLAGVLGLEYLRLMELAGYLHPGEARDVQQRGRPMAPHPLADVGLSHQEWHAVGAYIQALKAQRSR